VRVDYPHAWPEVFLQLLGTLRNGPVSIDLFLRTLNALDDDVVVNESSGCDSAVAARVKDSLREQCLPQLADVLRRPAPSFSPGRRSSDSPFSPGRLRLTRRCLLIQPR
jgi:hypothetical protein